MSTILTRRLTAATMASAAILAGAGFAGTAGPAGGLAVVMRLPFRRFECWPEGMASGGGTG